MNKTFKLSSEDLNKLTQYEASISHWSNEYTVLTLKSRKMLDAIDNLYQARQKSLDDFLKSQDVKLENVESVNVAPNGDVNVTLKESSS